jgi:hypothetical protein
MQRKRNFHMIRDAMEHRDSILEGRKEGHPVAAEDPKAWIRQYFLDEVWNEGNLALVTKLVARDCIVRDPAMSGLSGPQRGHTLGDHVSHDLP